MQEVRFDFGFPKNSKIKVILHVYYLLDIIFLIWISKILPLWLSFLFLLIYELLIYSAFYSFFKNVFFIYCLPHWHWLSTLLAVIFKNDKKKSNLKIYFHAHKNLPCKFYLFVFFRKFRNDFLLWLLLLVMIVRYHS